MEKGVKGLCESESDVAQLCLTLCDPMDCSLPGPSVHGIFQARVLEWVAISFSRGSSQHRDRTRVSHIAGRCFTIWATREAQRTFRAEETVCAKTGRCDVLNIVQVWGKAEVVSRASRTRHKDLGSWAATYADRYPHRRQSGPKGPCPTLQDRSHHTMKSSSCYIIFCV